MSTGNGPVIIKGDGRTDCQVDKPRCNSPSNGVGQIGICEHLEFIRWEKTHIEQENRALDTDQGWLVSSLKGKRELHLSAISFCRKWTYFEVLLARNDISALPEHGKYGGRAHLPSLSDMLV